MTAESTDLDIDDLPKKTPGKVPLVIGILLALLLGGGGFYAVSSGMILGPSAPTDNPAAEERLAVDGGDVVAAPRVVFLPLEPIVVSLGASAGSRYLRFRGELEVDPRHERDVTTLMPRILDTLNGYLRAVSVAELEDTASLLLLRAQMLRRIQIIVGDGRVHDLLIIEFVLS